MKKYILYAFCMLLAACSKKEIQPTEPTEPTNDNSIQTDEDAFQYVCSIGIPRFFDQNLPDYQLKAAVVNSRHSLLFYYNQETEQVRFYIEQGVVRPIEYDASYFNFETEKIGTYMYVTSENGKFVLKEITPRELAEEEQKNFHIGDYGISLGYGFKLKQTATFTFRGKIAQGNYQQDIVISYDPNAGWKTAATNITPDHNIRLAQVFGFSEDPMYMQFKKALENKQECFVKSKPPPFDSYPIKFKLSTSDDASSADIVVHVSKDDLLVNSKPVTPRAILSAFDEKDKIRNYPKAPLSINLVISTSSNDKLIRELIEAIKFTTTLNSSVTLKK